MTDWLSPDDLVKLRGAISFARTSKRYTLCDIEVGTLRALLNEMPSSEEIEISVEWLDMLVSSAEAVRGLSRATSKDGE